MRHFDLVIPSRWGVPLCHAVTRCDPPSPLAVVLFPGARYTCQAPLLYYARLVSLQRGTDVLCLEYGHQAARAELRGGGDMDRIAEESLQAVERFIGDGHRRVVFISKSLGTWVAGAVAARLALPVTHVFLTPIPGAVGAMRAAGGTAVVGSADPAFGEADRAQIRGVQGLDVRVVEGADHGLVVPGDHGRSLGVLREVTDVCDAVVAAARVSV